MPLLLLLLLHISAYIVDATALGPLGAVLRGNARLAPVLGRVVPKVAVEALKATPALTILPCKIEPICMFSTSALLHVSVVTPSTIPLDQRPSIENVKRALEQKINFEGGDITSSDGLFVFEQPEVPPLRNVNFREIAKTAYDRLEDDPIKRWAGSFDYCKPLNNFLMGKLGESRMIGTRDDLENQIHDNVLYAYDMAAALNILPDSGEKELYRGSFIFKDTLKEMQEKLGCTATVAFPTFTSFSSDREWVDKFAHSRFYPLKYTKKEVAEGYDAVIFTAKTKTAKDIRPWSPLENEFIVLPNTQFQVLSVTRIENFQLAAFSIEEFAGYLNERNYMGLAKLVRDKGINGEAFAREFAEITRLAGRPDWLGGMEEHPLFLELKRFFGVPQDAMYRRPSGEISSTLMELKKLIYELSMSCPRDPRIVKALRPLDFGGFFAPEPNLVPYYWEIHLEEVDEKAEHGATTPLSSPPLQRAHPFTSADTSSGVPVFSI